MIRVAVLGAGPSGLLAAEGVRQWGIVPTIISRPEPSRIGGAQYLHRAIPELTPDRSEGVVQFIKVGSATGYRKKVYDNKKVHTSWDEFDVGPHHVWNMQAAYNELWGRFSHYVVGLEIKADTVLALAQVFDLVISTIPAKAICRKHHSFEEQVVYISEGADAVKSDGEIIWSGQGSDDWYRQSSIFGHAFTEWPSDPGDRKVVRIRKPIKTDCDCYSDIPSVLKVGRYGEWRKGILSHHAYEGAIETIRRLNGVVRGRARLGVRPPGGSVGDKRARIVL